MKSYSLIQKLTGFAFILALLVVMLGAYTRLTDAGLGCPDWPGCYGKMVLPESKTALDQAQAKFPGIPIETGKAWTEMLHRYLAGTLGLLIFGIGTLVLSLRRQIKNLPVFLPIFLMVFVLFQALLGMWTVTLKLLPLVVMSHLLGGMLIVACLARFRLQLLPLSLVKADAKWRGALLVGTVIVFFQIALGGWVSANYAGIACVGFPTCSGFWWPHLDFAEGFHLFSPVGANYQGGLMDSEARMTIQFIHRLGAIVTALYIFILGTLLALRAKQQGLRLLGFTAALLVWIQFMLGILNVLYLLPIAIAVAHNGVAALLFATVFSLLRFTQKEKMHAA